MRKIFVLTTLIGALFVSCSKDDSNAPNETTCESVAEVVSSEDFNEINTSNYTVTDVQLNNDCLKVTISSSGCDPESWVMNVFSTDAFYTIYPYERAVKIKLVNDQDCSAVFNKTVSFDLTPFQLENQDELPLHIEGWNKQIIYKY